MRIGQAGGCGQENLFLSLLQPICPDGYPPTAVGYPPTAVGYLPHFLTKKIKSCPLKNDLPDDAIGNTHAHRLPRGLLAGGAVAWNHDTPTHRGQDLGAHSQTGRPPDAWFSRIQLHPSRLTPGFRLHREWGTTTGPGKAWPAANCHSTLPPTLHPQHALIPGLPPGPPSTAPSARM